MQVAAVFHAAAFLALLVLHYRALEGLVAFSLFVCVGGLFVLQYRYRERVHFAFFQVNSVLGFFVFLGIAFSSPG